MTGFVSKSDQESKNTDQSLKIEGFSEEAEKFKEMQMVKEFDRSFSLSPTRKSKQALDGVFE